MSAATMMLSDAAVRSSATEFGASVRPFDFDAWLARVRRDAHGAGLLSARVVVFEMADGSLEHTDAKLQEDGSLAVVVPPSAVRILANVPGLAEVSR